ncbi:hypothetical protein T03_3543, partial [Trichinella britovi]
LSQFNSVINDTFYQIKIYRLTVFTDNQVRSQE